MTPPTPAQRRRAVAQCYPDRPIEPYIESWVNGGQWYVRECVETCLMDHVAQAIADAETRTKEAAASLLERRAEQAVVDGWDQIADELFKDAARIRAMVLP